MLPFSGLEVSALRGPRRGSGGPPESGIPCPSAGGLISLDLVLRLRDLPQLLRVLRRCEESADANLCNTEYQTQTPQCEDLPALHVLCLAKTCFRELGPPSAPARHPVGFNPLGNRNLARSPAAGPGPNPRYTCPEVGWAVFRTQTWRLSEQWLKLFPSNGIFFYLLALGPDEPSAGAIRHRSVDRSPKYFWLWRKGRALDGTVGVQGLIIVIALVRSTRVADCGSSARSPFLPSASTASLRLVSFSP